MDKSLDEIIGSSKPAKSTGAPSGVGKRQRPQRSQRGRRGGATRGQNGSAQKSQKTVYIRNLSDAISEDDLRDLFRQVGPVVRVEMDRTPEGDRTGKAWVLYDFAEDALVAAERFNQRKAAGKTITVKRVSRIGDTGGNAPSLQERIGSSIPQGSRRNRKNRSSAPKPRPEPRNAEDLDAELDAYMQVDSAVPVEAEPPKEETMIDV